MHIIVRCRVNVLRRPREVMYFALAQKSVRLIMAAEYSSLRKHIHTENGGQATKTHTLNGHQINAALLYELL